MFGVKPRSYFKLDSISRKPSTYDPQVICDEISHALPVKYCANRNLTTFRENRTDSENKHRKRTHVGVGDPVFVRNDTKAHSPEPRYRGSFPFSKLEVRMCLLIPMVPTSELSIWTAVT